MSGTDAVMAVLPYRSRSAAADAPGAFADGCLAQADALYRTALRLTRNAAEAEDLVQDTFLKAFRGSGGFERGTNLRAWLFTILMNSFRNRQRDAARDVVAVDSDLVEGAENRPEYGATPEQQLLDGTLDADLQDALEALPDAFRQAVWLRDVEEFSYAEIARMLAIPAGTVMSRISRGRQLLFKRLSAARLARTAPAGTRG
jgi:RNA polymerase sigma-70 factor (ECF subfamily)